MTAINASKPRRKLATYGKTSRKHIHGHGQGVDSSHTRSHFTAMLVLDSARTPNLGSERWPASAYQDNHSGKDPDGLTKSKDCERPFPDAGKQSSRKAVNLAGAMIATEVERTCSSPASQPTLYNGLDELAIFDVPSSDEYDVGERSGSRAVTSRKRRKRTPATDERTDVIFDDDSLQRHIAHEDALAQGSICSVQNAEPLALEKWTACNDRRKSTRATKTTSDIPNRRRHSWKRTGTVSAISTSSEMVQREQGCSALRDPQRYNARSKMILPAIVKESPVSVVLQVMVGENGQSKSALSERLEHKPSTPSIPVRSTRSATNVQLGKSTSHMAEICACVKTSKATASTSTSCQAHLCSLDVRNSEVTAKFRATESVGVIMSDEELHHVSSTRQSPRKLVDALNQPRTMRLKRSHSPARDLGDNDLDSNDSHMHSSSEEGLTAGETSATSNTQFTNPGQVQGLAPAQPQEASVAPASGPRITYARQRSYITENASTEDEVFDIPINSGTDCRQERRRRGGRSMLPSLKPILSFQQENDVVAAAPGGGIRSIHELREAGGKYKFEHGIANLLDEIDNKPASSISQKRSSLLDLATKLCAPEFTSRFAEYGLEQRLFALADTESDQIASFLLASAIMFLLCSQPSSSPTSHTHNKILTSFVTRLLKAEEDVAAIARDRHTNTSKASRAAMLKFRTLVEQSSVWAHKPPLKISAQVVALRVLECITRQAREAGDSSELLSQCAVKQLIEIVELQLRKSEGPGASYYDSVTGNLALSILESCTMRHTLPTDEVVWTAESLSRIADLLPSTSKVFEGDAGEIRNLLLRLCLNLTNNNPYLCEAFSKPGIINAIFNIIDSHFQGLSQVSEEEKKALLLDNLILSLGSLINFAEWSDAARIAALTLQIGRVTLLEKLLQVFLDRIEVDSVEESHYNVPLGYLSVLLSSLCINDQVRAHVRARLHGQSLEPLLEAVEEFLDFHKKVDGQIIKSEGKDEPRIGFVKRLEDIIARLRHAEDI
ncbi:MAG: hypothetical protein M1830_003380 [Pleopsidium flavum]|nr:MAG: hypothetical protein M1830_003380 [Pleopsidium flavum]